MASYGRLDIRVEQVDASQANLVLRLAIESFEEYRNTLIPPPGILTETVDDVARYIERGGAVIVWAGDIPVGSARFHPEPSHLYIGRVSVAPAHRRTGIAAAMMRFLEVHGRSLGLTEAQVEVRQALPGNFTLYKALRYSAIAVQPHPRMPTVLTVRVAQSLRTGWCGLGGKICRMPVDKTRRPPGWESTGDVR